MVINVWPMYLHTKMTLDDYSHPVERSVWENKNGSRVTTVTGLLEEGKYRVEKTKDDDGNIVLKYIHIEDG